MAKGNFLTTVVRKKLGNMVGYKITNSNDKERQGWRAYNSQVKNPRSAAQARQRMIMGNLTRNYGALKPILSRSWEGVPYGGKSYQRFLKMNMSMAGEGPFVPKDRKTPLPGRFVLSAGSLISVMILGLKQHPNTTNFITDLYSSASSTLSTVGGISTALKVNNTDIQDGDQLTFICVSETENLEYVYRFSSFIVDSTSDAALTYGLIPGTLIRINTAVPAGGTTERNITFTLIDPENDEVPVAGAVIQSRQDGNGGFLRSPSEMWVDEGNTDLTQYWSPEYYNIALASYMDAAGGRTSDWPTEADPETTDPAALVIAPYHFVQDTIDQTLNCQFVSRGSEQLMVVASVDGTDYPLDPLGHILAYNETLIEARNATPVIGTIKRSDLAALGL